MSFDLHIKNIGKLNDAKLRIGRFTVLAGPNNTGKSFVSKILYSLFDAMNVNPAEVQMHRLTTPIWESLWHLPRRLRASAGAESHETSPLDLLSNEIHNMENRVAQCAENDFEDLDQIILEMANNVKHLLAGFPASLQELLSAQEAIFADDDLQASILISIKESLEKLSNDLAQTDAQKFIIAGIESKVRENILQNFQVSNLASLRLEENRAPETFIENIGEFKFVNGRIDFHITQVGWQQLQHYSKVIYLESPVYWKLKSPLEDIRLSPRHRHTRRQRITGIPGYFYDLASDLRSQYTGDMAFPELHEKLTGKDGIEGKLVLSDTGEILFHENDRTFPLSVTATGVINLGILALLIERKILDKDSFVFIDEPEAHLHPAWQVVMAETLFELAKGGAHVVIATHSIDILKWLEVHAKKNPQDKELIALNQFHAQNVDGDALENGGARDFDDKMASILQELTAPFAKTFREGI